MWVVGFLSDRAYVPTRELEGSESEPSQVPKRSHRTGFLPIEPNPQSQIDPARPKPLLG
jgi:hypothetical protein